ncbi:hypothetical protein E1B28_006322 [Marasmius oreades]|uniref:Uncharacterized protein n=1 Tax=Marasmius oreades TaxID=181124 RepID=A0A9P7S598_9AGAR|nr:uncharacterized protein E1B28_006322 [Marasmius oreades]KAG7095592.1 hypothetical protein E1B28_006322 [Marasmius oreades]
MCVFNTFSLGPHSTESEFQGFLYPASLVVYIAILSTLDPDNQSLLPVDLSPLFMQAAGIAPTLIVVRALQEKTTDSVPQVVSASNVSTDTTSTTAGSQICFAHGRETTAIGMGQAMQSHHSVYLPVGHAYSRSGASASDVERVIKREDETMV